MLEIPPPACCGGRRCASEARLTSQSSPWRHAVALVRSCGRPPFPVYRPGKASRSSFPKRAVSNTGPALRTITRVMSSWRRMVARPVSLPRRTAARAQESVSPVPTPKPSGHLHCVHSRDHKKFAEPVSLSSALPTNFRLPPTAARLGFDLLALRARRKRDSRDVKRSDQGLSERRVRNLQKIQFSTFSTRSEAGLWTILWIGAKRPSTKCERQRREPPNKKHPLG